MQFSQSEQKELIFQFLPEGTLSALEILLSPEEGADFESAAKVVVDVMGVTWTKCLWSNAESTERIELENKLLTSFHNNVNLLVQKTWVEKCDETFKEQVLYKLDQFCRRGPELTYKKKYTIFSEIIRDVVFLMFGAQSRQKDFMNYALRIDPDFGVFWWLIEKIQAGIQKKVCWSEERYRAFLLLGMLFLSNY